MIIDSLHNLKRYNDLHPLFHKAFLFLIKHESSLLEPGTYQIDGERLYAVVSRKEGKKKSEARLEYHQKYIDIQYVVKGCDTMGWKPLRDCGKPESAFNTDKDLGFFLDEPDAWYNVPPGCFAIFFPEDAHAPMVGDSMIHKIILKVAIE